MDIDGVQEVELINLFELSRQTFPWREPRPSQIEERRALMSDLLIFDILLSSGGIGQPDLLYPPADVDSLQRLLDAIEESAYDTLKKECLVYFLLKWHQDGREERFMHERCIPPQFAALADAYWHLDSGINVERAVSILSDSRLSRDYTSKILQAISISENTTPLILKYVRTAKPTLTEPDDIEMYAMALFKSSLLEVWQFQRTFPAHGVTRSKLIRKILDWSLLPKPKAEPLKQLVAFPFNEYEISIIHEYALHPPTHCVSSSVAIIQDLVCVRLIQGGNHAAAIKLDRQFSASSSNLTPQMRKSLQDRGKMMEDVLAAMTSVERSMLELELEGDAQGSTTVTASNSGESMSVGLGASSNDLGMSWEDLRPQPPLVNSSLSKSFGEPPVVPLSKRAGAPNFGSSFSPLPKANGNGSSTARNLFDPPTSFQSPSRSSLNTPISTAFPPSFPPPQIPLRPSGLLLAQSSPKNPLQRFTPSSSMRDANAPPSLFSSVGSANSMRNAFYEPPKTSNKRPFGQDVPRPQEEPARHRPPSPRNVNHEILMDTEDELDDEDHRKNSSATNGAEEPAKEIPFSLFSGPANTNTRGQRSSRPQAPRTETQTKMPPGAFMPDSDDELDQLTRPNTKQRPKAPSPPPPPAQKPRQTRRSRPGTSSNAANLGRSLPGSLMADEEEEDYVAPLAPQTPATARTARKGRTSRATSQNLDGGDLVAPRRSTRLSAAPSATSLSPEPSPQKPPPKARKSTRGSTGQSSAAPSKSRARKKQ